MAAREGAAATLQKVATSYDRDTRRTTETPTNHACRVLHESRTRRDANGTLVMTERLQLSIVGLAADVEPTEADKLIVGATTYLIKVADRESPDGSTIIAWRCEVTGT
jgi:hypothetical protein